MVRKPKRPCNHAGCNKLTDSRFCDAHRKQYKRAQDRHRGSASERGYTHSWHKARGRYLREHPLCVRCRQNGQLTAANVVDHIVPHRGDMDLFWDEDNWQSLCKLCHDRKTATEDSSFARKK